MRAKDVQVATHKRAYCRRADCTLGEGGQPWQGPLRDDYWEANEDRGAHLNWHALGQPEVTP